MEQLEFFSIPSPCVGVCTADAKGYCSGCYRSREERLYWLKMSDSQKQVVLRLCRMRQRRLLRVHDDAVGQVEGQQFVLFDENV